MSERQRANVLYRNGRVCSPADPHATALLVRDGRVAWLGATGDAPTCEHVVDLDGDLVTPAFVDAHAHTTDSGIVLVGLDLTGAGSAGEVLDREVLAQLAQDLDAELLADVLRQFMEETRERVARIAGESDRAVLMREAHTLKSTAGTFGARALCSAARALEMACRASVAEPKEAKEDGAEDGAADAVERLRGEIPRLAGDAIAAYRAAGYPV